MFLLDGHSLTKTRKVKAVSMNLQLKERDSTASITLTGDGSELDGIAIGKWMLDENEPGAGIVWQVRSVQQAFIDRAPVVQLEHVIYTLKDKIMFGEITPATITGTVGATTCTARQAVEYILGQQSDWTLGDFDYGSISNPYKFDGETLFDALETVTASLEDAYWTYDTTEYPFTLNIVQKSAEVDSELRASRNIRTVSRTIDKSGMYTRFYPIGKDDLHVSGEYVEKNTSTYGVISKVETDNSIDTEAELVRWANERLNIHAEPVVTVTVEGLELSRETGETLDSLTIGRVCRIPLPEYGTTIQERITEISYQDKINQPEIVRITMANVRNDVTKIISDMMKNGGRGGRASARKDKEDHAWFEDTNDHVAMVAEGIIGVDAQGNPNWTRLSEFIADGEGLHLKVETQMAGVTDRVATLEISEEEIRTEVAASSSDIYSYISQTAEGIEIAAAASSSTMYSVIETTATSISSEVVRRTRVFVQITDPALVPSNNVREGDIWVKSIKMQTWSEMSAKTWENSADFNWNQYSGSPQFVWDGTKWEPLGDQGAVVEYGTRIEQTERNISLIARAIGAIDPSSIAEIDISAEAIQSAVSTAKSELYSVIRQTATNITNEVVDDINGISSYVEQTAYSLNQTIARKNRVFVQLTDPVYNTGVTVIDGDIWIKSAGNDNVKQTWGELSAKTWNSQNSTNWREYYEGYWYVRKNNKWEIMNANADVVEIGTMLEQDEKHIALIARDVDANHHELGARLEVTAREIRGEVHAAKSSLYTTISQTATSIRLEVVSTKSELSSSITQTASSIRSEVNAAKSTIYSSITQTASQIRAEVSNVQAGLNSSITQTASQIRTEVRSTASGLQSQITQNAGNIELKVSKNGVISSINQTPESITINASRINLTGYVTATNFSSVLANLASAHINKLYVDTNIYAPNGLSIYSNGVWQLSLSQSGNTYTLKEKKLNGDERTVGTFSRAVSSMGVTRSGAVYSITPSPQGSPTLTVGFSSTADIALEIVTNGTPTLDPMNSKWVTAPMKVQQLNGQAEPTVIDNFNKTIDATASYNSGKTDGYSYFYGNSHGYWSGHWTGDGTHGSTSGKHYVTGPNSACDGWECYYCIEDEAASAGLNFEAHTHNGYLNRAQCGVDQYEMPIYYGKLYMWTGSGYAAITSNDYYWFYSSSSFGGSRTVYY